MNVHKAILLKDIWLIENPSDYKIHFARWNGEEHPLNAWVRNPEHFQDWQEYRPVRDAFNRTYIFSLMRFYHEEDAWLFGGVFRVCARHEDRYVVELTEIGGAFIGRLKLRSSYRGMAARVNFENYYDTFEVREIIREQYSGQTFPGYEEIDLPFSELEHLVQNDRTDWKAALKNVSGVYMITDTNTGKRYIGSAYGDDGIWSRWTKYARSGHGGNAELRELVKSDLRYPRRNFRFVLLEYRSASTPEGIIIKREKFWKDALLTRSEQYGLNSN